MKVLGILGFLLLAGGIYWWLVLPKLREQPWWEGFVTRLYALAGNSKTIAAGYAAEALGLLDEAKLLDWSQLIGSERAGRVMAIMGAVMIGLRLVTRAAVSFKA